MAIIQGSNDPIILPFDEDVSTVPDIAVGLYDWKSRCVKQWKKSELIYGDDFRVLCPLTQEETARFEAGRYNVLVKLVADDGHIIFYDRFPVSVMARSDRGVMLHAKPD